MLTIINKYVCSLILFSIGCNITSIYGQPASFIHVSAGTYTVGEKNNNQNPLRTVYIQSFDIAATELTNTEFDHFVKATGYITVAEKFKDAQVFEPGLEEFRWITDSTSSWRYPNGITRGGIANKMNHPVTGICYADAQAYCKWANVRLPTFEEWEIAARAGSSTQYFEGVTQDNISEYGNIWHGVDHMVADSSDGFMYTAPVASFKPNPWGLYDVLGNVFEFCTGALPRDDNRKVAHARGGSWWCSKNACNFYNVTDIGAVNPHASFSNLGFRVVKLQQKSSPVSKL